MIKQKSSWREEIEEFNKTNKFPIVIGLCGKARSGKDTVGFYLKDKYQLSKVAFADILKHFLIDFIGLTYEQCYGDQKEILIPKYNKSPREILQWFGTDVMRSLYDDIWVEAIFNKLKSGYYENNIIKNGFVITDVRFPNEVRFINLLGGKVVHVIRPNQEEIKSNQHSSETSIDIEDNEFILMNDGTIEDLEKEVDDMITSFRGEEY